MKKIKINFIQLLLLTLIPCIIVSIISGTLTFNRLTSNGKSSLTNNKNINEFINVYNKLIDEYYEDLDETTLVESAINGMLSYTGDDYTIYLNEDATNSLNEKLEGTYEGIGVRISMNDSKQIYIYEVFNDTPASNAGLQVNDIVKSINDKVVEGLSTNEVAKIIQSNKEANIKITVERNGETLSFDLERKTLIVPAITSSIKEINNRKVGYMYLETFSNTLDTQFKATLTSLEKDGIDSLIIDLRNNTGGYLESCTKIIEMFLKKDSLMYTIKSKKESKDYFDTTDEKREYDVVVLINGSSASASEILASSLKYSYGAKVIGEKSFGKGKVQTTGTLKDGTMIKYTTALWYTPNKDCIDKVGLIPDIEISLSDEYKNNPIEENDNQLNEALRILSE